MGRLSVLAASATLVSLAGAFCVDFNSGERCTGTVVGRYTGSTGTGCQTAFTRANSSESVLAPGGAFDVVIQPQSADNKSGVAFFGQPDCEVLIGFGNVPLCTGVGAWSSFKVITLDEADDQLTNLDPAPVLSIPSNATAAVGRGDSLTVPSGMLEDMSGTPGTSSTTDVSISSGTSTAIGTTGATTTTTSSDGMMTTMGIATPGKIRRTNRRGFSKRMERSNPQKRYEDYASPAKRGQSPARHHARAIGPVGGSNHDFAKRGVSPRSPSPLIPRAISPSKCNLVRSCMIDTGDNDNFGISEAGPALLRALETVNPEGTSWQYLREPFVVEVTDDAAQSLGLVYAQTIEHAGVASCSDSGSESDAFKSALEMGVAGSQVTDMRVDLKLRTGDGVTNSLFVSTRKAGNADMNIHPICEAIQVFD
ncbi:MAG: hypothetical protein LQ339_001847 [Xanthoria mediterranea]|nr:MAG: hypothetical protein LQ339_001847 [Xanthoria mediterranea]